MVNEKICYGWLTMLICTSYLQFCFLVKYFNEIVRFTHDEIQTSLDEIKVYQL